MTKYLSEREIFEILGEISFEFFVPMSQDSYNEAAILNSISATKKEQELCFAAINMATIGFGNKRYGNFKSKNVVVDIATLLTSCGVKIGLAKDAKLKEDDLTPQRLCRAFRHHIRAYLKDTRMETYLHRKYSAHDNKFADLMFRGAEYLDDLKPDEVNYLLETYRSIDGKANTNISERIIRVFQAKGYLKRTVQEL